MVGGCLVEVAWALSLGLSGAGGIRRQRKRAVEVYTSEELGELYHDCI